MLMNQGLTERDEMPNLIGQRLGQYDIIAPLGEGGMATVYRARQESMRREVAVKVIGSGLANNPEFIRRFQREAQTVARLSSVNILKVFDYGRQDDVVYLVMELLLGGSLSDLLQRGNRLPADQVSKILDQMAAALDYAHREGIVHRDLKPQNVLFDKPGNVILADFGIAKLLTETTELTQNGTVLGTPAYMSPEQWQGDTVDSRADVYALGVIVFEMLTGRVPFQGSTHASVMYMHLRDSPPPLHTLRADLPAGLEPVIGKALAKDPQYRFQSAGDMAAAFKAVLQKRKPTPQPEPRRSAQELTTLIEITPPSVVVPHPPTLQIAPAPKRTGGWAVGLLVLIIVIGAILGFAVLSKLTANTPINTQTTEAPIKTNTEPPQATLTSAPPGAPVVRASLPTSATATPTFTAVLRATSTATAPDSTSTVAALTQPFATITFVIKYLPSPTYLRPGK